MIDQKTKLGLSRMIRNNLIAAQDEISLMYGGCKAVKEAFSENKDNALDSVLPQIFYELLNMWERIFDAEEKDKKEMKDNA